MLAVALSMTLATSACSTSYMPRQSPRVQVIMRRSIPAYVRDGKIYDGGGFGGDLDLAVSGNPEAVAHAKAYQTGLATGFVASILGGVSMGTGLITYGTSPDDNASQQVAGAGLFFAGFAATLLGAVLSANAMPHQWDAINVYNDGLTPPQYVPPPAGATTQPPLVDSTAPRAPADTLAPPPAPVPPPRPPAPPVP